MPVDIRLDPLNNIRRIVYFLKYFSRETNPFNFVIVCFYQYYVSLESIYNA